MGTVGDESKHEMNRDYGEEYIFHYPVSSINNNNSSPLHHNKLAEMVRGLLENLLDIIVLQSDGKDLKPDSFRWLVSKEGIYEIFDNSRETSHKDTEKGNSPDSYSQIPANYHNVLNASFYEPRISLIQSVIESVLTLVEMEYKGQTIKVDGFRLKDLRDWLVQSTGDPAEIFEYMASRCTCDCVFCCNKGNPDTIAACSHSKQSAYDELCEVETRMKYLSPLAGRALFPSIGNIYEVLANKHALEILKQLRSKTDLPIRITTNGNMLTPNVVAELSELKPVYLYLSLNSASEKRRKRIMKDPRPQIAIGSLSLLKKFKIPYAAVIVPWLIDSVDEMLDDLSSTVAFAIANDAHLIQVNLPGYSRYFSTTEIFDRDMIWSAIVDKVISLRELYDYPIVTMPTLYEENIHEPSKNMAHIIGLVRNSPAHLGGLLRGDLLLQVDGIRVHNRPQARDILAAQRKSGAAVSILKIKREGNLAEVRLNLHQHSYPYTEGIDDYMGIVFAGSGFRTSYLETLKEIIDIHQAKHVLFLSSWLMKPTFEQCLAESHLFNNQIEIEIEIPQNTFLGGNICMGDLLVVQDFIDCINDFVIRKGTPDLVIIPSSPFNLSGWGRDIVGRVYLDIERQTRIPVELLPCTTSYS